MHLEEILHQLEEAVESEDWELVQKSIDSIREQLDNPFDDYKDEDWGWLGNRQVLFDNKVQQRLSMSRYKRLTNSNGDKSLQGLEIDWHLANLEMGFDNFVEPVLDSQPSYAYA